MKKGLMILMVFMVSMFAIPAHAEMSKEEALKKIIENLRESLAKTPDDDVIECDLFEGLELPEENVRTLAFIEAFNTYFSIQNGAFNIAAREFYANTNVNENAFELNQQSNYSTMLYNIVSYLSQNTMERAPLLKVASVEMSYPENKDKEVDRIANLAISTHPREPMKYYDNTLHFGGSIIKILFMGRYLEKDLKERFYTDEKKELIVAFATGDLEKVDKLLHRPKIVEGMNNMKGICKLLKIVKKKSKFQN